MNRPSIGLLLAGLLCIGIGCDQGRTGAQAAADSLAVAERLARFERALAQGDGGDKSAPIALWKLPDVLAETSGLALTADGRLLTHGDELGQVFEVDYRRGVIVKSFTLGSPAVKGDFEAIAAVGDTLWLLTMEGELYRFQEGAADSKVSYDKIDTGLGNICEFEAMTYDSAGKALVLACKEAYDKALKGALVLFRVPLAPGKDGKPAAVTRLDIPLEQVIGNNPWKKFHPSDMTVDPKTGNYVIVASIEKALLELTPTGKVVWSRPLPPGHAQAEGIAISPENLLILSDEAKNGPARITLYRWP